MIIDLKKNSYCGLNKFFQLLARYLVPEKPRNALFQLRVLVVHLEQQNFHILEVVLQDVVVSRAVLVAFVSLDAFV